MSEAWDRKRWQVLYDSDNLVFTVEISAVNSD